MKTNKIVLIKQCPDGSQTMVKFENEEELRKHLEAMWKYTTG